MTMINRRLRNLPTNGQPGGKNINTKNFNKQSRLIDGFKYTINAGGTSTQTIVLSATGRFLLGLSLIPITGSDITNMAFTFNINGLNLTNGANANNFNPANILKEYFDLPQPLKGNDAINATFVNNGAADATLYLDVFYLPRV
jgi:hypothetical protein